jgi:hypothetical protein
MQRQGRSLGDVNDFEVQLYLDLQFVQEIVAIDFESMDNSDPNVAHFCGAVRAQV